MRTRAKKQWVLRCFARRFSGLPTAARWTGWAALGLAPALACSGPGSDREQAAPPRDVAATVGSGAIPLGYLKSVSEARSLSPRDALDGLVRDALFAQEVARRKPRLASYLNRIALARTLTVAVLADAEQQGPPTAQEVEEFTNYHWYQLDRPPMARTVQALIKLDGEENRQVVRETAEKLRTTLLVATSVENFIERAKAFDAEPLKVTIEALDAVAADGRTANPDSPPRPGSKVNFYKRRFAEAAVALEADGEVSDLIETEYGYHVLMLRDRLPAQRFSHDERAKRLKAVIVEARARRMQKEMLSSLRDTNNVEVERSAVSAMGVFQPDRPASP